MGMSHWWWPFGKDRREESKETENDFQSQLAEALLRRDDLKEAAASMKRERLERERRTQQRDTKHKLKLG